MILEAFVVRLFDRVALRSDASGHRQESADVCVTGVTPCTLGTRSADQNDDDPAIWVAREYNGGREREGKKETMPTMDMFHCFWSSGHHAFGHTSTHVME